MKSAFTSKTHRPYLMAVVLGTALAAVGSESVASADEISPRAINNISRYCTACWRNARLPQDQWNDCTQEVLTRLLRNLPAQSWEQALANETEERREFIRAIDAVKKRYQRGRWQSAVLPELVADARHEEARDRDDERAAVQQASEKVLSHRQRHILKLICDGHNVADIATELAMSPERVSDEKYKAIQKLRTYFHTETVG
ncbi:MAG: sigma-70 family RNA polymerase sigma factor [Planctomycetes bacterium]|nr:sigma-70 family RNA polymerase sigma factor [Planctomycetota bacterium]